MRAQILGGSRSEEKGRKKRRGRRQEVDQGVNSRRQDFLGNNNAKHEKSTLLPDLVVLLDSLPLITRQYIQ